MKQMKSIAFTTACFCLLFISCQQAADKQVKSLEEKVEKIEKSEKDGSWLQKLIAAKAHSEAELLAKFPKQLAEIPFRSSNAPAAQTAVGTYSLHANPNHQTENITITIVDGAGDYGFGHLNAIHKLIAMEINNQETNGWAKTKNHKGNRILLKEFIDKGIQFSELEYIKNNRYHITLTGRKYDSNKLLQAKDDLEKIEF